jgi:hypothetical protein
MRNEEGGESEGMNRERVILKRNGKLANKGEMV